MGKFPVSRLTIFIYCSHPPRTNTSSLDEAASLEAPIAGRTHGTLDIYMIGGGHDISGLYIETTLSTSEMEVVSDRGCLQWCHWSGGGFLFWESPLFEALLILTLRTTSVDHV